MAAEQHDATTEFNGALKAAFDGGAYDELAGFYTEDAVLLPPRGRMVEGRNPISTFWRGVKTRYAEMVFNTTGLKTIGETVKRETGTYSTVTVNGVSNAIEGKYVFVWQNVDGEWQIESSIWNRGGAPGQGQRGRGQGGGQRRGGGAPGGGQRQQGGGAVGGNRQGGGGYRQGGQGGGGYRQGGGRPSFQAGGGGIGGGQRRGGGGQRRGGGGQGPQGGAGSLYDQGGGLYSDLKE